MIIILTLYHGTSKQFATPSLEFAKPYRDFGRAFYLAENYFDALPMAIKNSRQGFVYTYELEDTDGLNMLILDGYSDEWLSFVVQSRLGARSDFDLVIGNTAGGGANLKSKFSKLRRSDTCVKEAMIAVRNELTHTKLGVQYAFLTQEALSRLKLTEAEQIFRED